MVRRHNDEKTTYLSNITTTLLGPYDTSLLLLVISGCMYLNARPFPFEHTDNLKKKNGAL